MRIRFALPLSGALVALSLMLPAAALAHEQRDVGKYHFAVGFLNEPAIQDQMNAIDLTVTTSADKQPVQGAEKSLKAEVIVGGNAATMPIALESRFGQPGKYAAYFMPTATGAYQFHFTGSINGDPVDQKFESGPNTFNNVAPIAALQFPQKLGDPAAIQKQLADAESAANTARLFGIAGIIAGVLGLGLGAVAITRKGAEA